MLSDLLADPNELVRWRDRCDRLLAAEGAGHLVHDLAPTDAPPPSRAGRGASTRFLWCSTRPSTGGWSAMVKERRSGARSTARRPSRRLRGAYTLFRCQCLPEALARDVGQATALPDADRQPADSVALRDLRDRSSLQTARRGVAHRAAGDLTDAPVGSLGYALLDRSAALAYRAPPDFDRAHGVATLGRVPLSPRYAAAPASVSEERARAPSCSQGGTRLHPSYTEQA